MESTLASVLDVLRELRDTQRMTIATLDNYVWREAALLPARILEFASTSEANATTLTIEPQTGDVEMIEGVLVTLSGSNAETVTLSLGDDIEIPIPLTNGFALLSPVKWPIASNFRQLSFPALSSQTVSVVMWGLSTPARTRTVH